MAKTEFIRARVEPELKAPGRRDIFKARVVPNRCNHAVLCPGYPARWLALPGQDSQ